jgi:DNA-binding transcriptional MerR regulator
MEKISKAQPLPFPPQPLAPVQEIPDKLFFKIGEVSRIVGVEPYILRYWESEFPALRPRKNRSGQRVYVKADLDLLFKIKQMLYQDRYTIAGAKQRLNERQSVRPKAHSRPGQDSLERVKKSLREILEIMDRYDRR